MAGWGLFFAVLYVVATTEHTLTVYDPFAILDISPVRTSYVLELIYHLRNFAHIRPSRVRQKSK